jgi:Rod binding domain-containing protein
MTPAAAIASDTPKPATAPADPQLRSRIEKSARDFEASFLSVVLGEMFEGVSGAGPFGGGEGEAMFKSFLTDSMAKSMAGHGGIGLSKRVMQEMLRMQGLDHGAAA